MFCIQFFTIICLCVSLPLISGVPTLPNAEKEPATAREGKTFQAVIPTVPNAYLYNYPQAIVASNPSYKIRSRTQDNLSGRFLLPTDSITDALQAKYDIVLDLLYNMNPLLETVQHIKKNQEKHFEEYKKHYESGPSETDVIIVEILKKIYKNLEELNEHWKWNPGKPVPVPDKDDKGENYWPTTHDDFESYWS